jgi:hypothetical protein
LDERRLYRHFVKEVFKATSMLLQEIGIAQSVGEWAMGWNTEASGFDSR